MGENGNLFAIIVLVVVTLVLLGGWLAFPTLAHFMQRQDCVASGRMNC